MKYVSGEQFLNKLYSDMYLEYIVSCKTFNGDTPEDKIEKYITRIENVHNIAKLSKHKMELLKTFYYNKYIIKELPENYIRLQRRIASKNGIDHIDLDALLLYVQNEQKSSLDKWIDYLSSNPLGYPTWFQVYVFRGVVRLNSFDKKQQSFGKRTSTTISPYIELNEGVLEQVYNTLSSIIGVDRKLTEEEVKALNNGESFKKLYTHYLLNSIDFEKYEDIDGRWIKYEQGGNYRKMLDSIKNKQTGWCIDSDVTCKKELDDGDFYIYYTKDKNHEFTIPRIAIRMKGKKIIIEVRGIAPRQGLEKNMSGIAYEKASYLINSNSYNKRINDMNKLSRIAYKTNLNQGLTIDELRFLYEIGSKIEDFNLERDPRIEKIKKQRDIKKDLALIFKCKPCNIADKISDFYGDNEIIAFTGNLKVDSTSVPKELKYLKYIAGWTDFSNLCDTDGLENLAYIGGSAMFSQTISARGLKNLRYIGGNCSFSLLRNANGLENLQRIYGSADFSNLIDARGLKSLEIIKNNAYFSELEDTKGLNKLRYIGRIAKFPKVTDASGLVSLSYIGGRTDFSFLKNSYGLEKLRYIGEDAYFLFLEDASSLYSLETISGRANFPALKNSAGLNNLQNIGGDASYSSLEETNCLTKLIYIGGSACFSEVKSANGLISLQYIGVDALFHNLNDASDLHNLNYIGNIGYFDNLSDLHGLENLINLGMKLRIHNNDIDKLQPQIKEKVLIL